MAIYHLKTNGRLASRALYKTAGGKTPDRSSLSYSYDNDDNITGIADGVNGANSRTYGYDMRGRLAMVEQKASGQIIYNRQDYLHDANGNRTAFERRFVQGQVAPDTVDTYTRTPGTNLLASISTASGTRNLIYDARGNTASETRPGGITVSTGYDGHGRLVSYSQSGSISLAHSYNGLGDRTATTATPSGGSADTRRFVTAPDGRIMGEYGTSATDVKAEFIWLSPQVGDTGPFGGDDGLGGYMPIAMVNGTTLSWVHGDHLGTPIVITNASGTAIAQPSGYYATAFPGQSKTRGDLYYNRYRDYDPTTGRYIQADPIGLAGGASPYSYAMGNPLRYTDPKGTNVLALIPEAAALCLTPAGAVVCTAAGAAALVWYYWLERDLTAEAF
jgi:RHS repeat-associated protein